MTNYNQVAAVFCDVLFSVAICPYALPGTIIERTTAISNNAFILPHSSSCISEVLQLQNPHHQLFLIACPLATDF